MDTTHPLFSLQEFQVEDSVGYLLKRTRAMLVNTVDETLSEQGYEITQAQGSLLFMLSTGKYRTAADLVREICIDAASMKRMIDRLVAHGLILRVPSAQDRRVKTLHLTPKGEELSAEIWRVAGRLRSELLRDIPLDEVERSMALLSQLHRRLEQLQ